MTLSVHNTLHAPTLRIGWDTGHLLVDLEFIRNAVKVYEQSPPCPNQKDWAVRLTESDATLHFKDGWVTVRRVDKTISTFKMKSLKKLISNRKPQ